MPFQSGWQGDKAFPVDNNRAFLFPGDLPPQAGYFPVNEGQVIGGDACCPEEGFGNLRVVFPELWMCRITCQQSKMQDLWR